MLLALDVGNTNTVLGLYRPARGHRGPGGGDGGVAWALSVIPAKAGIQEVSRNFFDPLDPRLRGDDGVG